MPVTYLPSGAATDTQQPSITAGQAFTGVVLAAILVGFVYYGTKDSEEEMDRASDERILERDREGLAYLRGVEDEYAAAMKKRKRYQEERRRWERRRAGETQQEWWSRIT